MLTLIQLLVLVSEDAGIIPKYKTAICKYQGPMRFNTRRGKNPLTICNDEPKRNINSSSLNLFSKTIFKLQKKSKRTSFPGGNALHIHRYREPQRIAPMCRFAPQESLLVSCNESPVRMSRSTQNSYSKRGYRLSSITSIPTGNWQWQMEVSLRNAFINLSAANFTSFLLPAVRFTLLI